MFDSLHVGIYPRYVTYDYTLSLRATYIPIHPQSSSNQLFQTILLLTEYIDGLDILDFSFPPLAPSECQAPSTFIL